MFRRSPLVPIPAALAAALAAACALAPPAAADDAAEAAAAEAEPIVLKPLGSISFGPEPAVGPVRNVSDFDGDDRGRIGFARFAWDDAQRPAFVLFNPAAGAAGEVLLEVTPDGLAEMDGPSLFVAWTGGDSWLLVASPDDWESDPSATAEELGPARAWRFNLNSKLPAAPLAAFGLPRVWSLAGTGDGGFVAVAAEPGGYDVPRRVVRCDPDGRVLWRVDEDPDDPRAVESPGDVAVSAAGRVGVLSGVTDELRVFSADGVHLRTTRLDAVLQREPVYLSGLSADGPGSDGMGADGPGADGPGADGAGGDRWTVRDARASSAQDPASVVRLDEWPPGAGPWDVGWVREEFTPRFRDGRAVDSGKVVRSPDDGRLWTAEEQCLLRLTEAGVVDRTYGPAPDPAVLGEIAAVAVGPRGNPHVVDARTGAVHVFDAAGRPLRVLAPQTTDFARALFDPRIAVAADGTTLVGSGEGDGDPRGNFIAFSPAGRRLGRVFRGEEIWNWWRLRSDGGRWIAASDAVELRAADGALRTTIRLRPDGAALDYVQEIAVAPDDGAAVVNDAGVHLYDANGVPLRTLPLPGEGQSAVLGATWAATAVDGDVFLARRSGGPVRRFTPPERPDDGGDPWLILATDPAGRELWVHNYGARRVDRYALP